MFYAEFNIENKMLLKRDQRDFKKYDKKYTPKNVLKGKFFSGKMILKVLKKKYKPIHKFVLNFSAKPKINLCKLKCLKPVSVKA